MTTQPANHADPAPNDDCDRMRIVELVEEATRRPRHCACGSSMTVGATGDTLWLECPTFKVPRSGLLAGVRSGIRSMLHERHIIARGFSLAA
jgi:hypothetical protein